MIRTLSGANNLLLRAELDRLVDDFVSKYGEMAVERLDGEEAEYSKITEAVQSQPFLSDKKLVILSRPGAQKQFVENLEELIESISDSTTLIIIEPKPDKRSSYYKLLQKKTEFKSFDELSSRDLPRWLSEQAKERGGLLSMSDAQYLVDRVGANQQLIINELTKLMTYDPKITRRTIDWLTDSTPQSTIFQLLDAAFAGDIKRTLKLYQEQRALKVEPIQIIAMLGWQLYALAVVKAAGNKSSQEIAKEAGLSPFVIQKSQAIANKLSMARLKKMIHDLSELDIKTKSTAIDPDEALQHYLLTISVDK